MVLVLQEHSVIKMGLHVEYVIHHACDVTVMLIFALNALIQLNKLNKEAVLIVLRVRFQIMMVNHAQVVLILIVTHVQMENLLAMSVLI